MRITSADSRQQTADSRQQTADNKPGKFANLSGTLQTLPNLDINIKVGNSLVSRVRLDQLFSTKDQKARRLMADSIARYRVVVQTYKTTKDRTVKRAVEREIADLKTRLSTLNFTDDPEQVKLRKLKNDLWNLSMDLGGGHEARMETLGQEIFDIEARQKSQAEGLFRNAFEWRFEFPEVLDEEGNFVGFDVVISNPPYILLQNIGDESLLDYCRRQYSTATYKVDTYPLFFERAFSLINSFGLLSFITPNTYFTNKHSVSLRKNILKNGLYQVINFQTKVFEDASVDTAITLTAMRKNDGKISYSSSKDFKDLLNRKETLFPVENFLSINNIFEFNMDGDSNELISKIEHKSVKLKEIGRAYFGIQTQNRKKNVSFFQESGLYRPVIDGTNVCRYFYLPNEEYVNFIPSAIKSGGNLDVYAQERIVVRQIGVYPEGTIVEKGVFTLNTIYNIFLFNYENFSLKFILSVLNCKLSQFVWNRRFYDNKETFPKIKKEPLESLLIPKIPLSAQQPLIDLVETILSAKKANPAADTSAAEAEIDALVYQLYGLTAEEIALVEGR